MIRLEYKTPIELQRELADRVRARRKEHKLSQEALAQKSGVSLGSLKRFESTGEVSLASFIKIAFALGYAEEIEDLLSEQYFSSIEDVIAHAEKHRR